MINLKKKNWTNFFRFAESLFGIMGTGGSINFNIKFSQVFYKGDQLNSFYMMI